jgi:hypothetical protein
MGSETLPSNFDPIQSQNRAFKAMSVLSESPSTLSNFTQVVNTLNKNASTKYVISDIE